MDQNQTKQTGRKVTGIIAAVMFFVAMIITIATAGFQVTTMLICLALCVASILFGLGKKLPAGIIVLATLIIRFIDLFLLFSGNARWIYGEWLTNRLIIVTIVLIIGTALLGVAMLVPKVKGLAWAMPVSCIFDVIYTYGEYSYYDYYDGSLRYGDYFNISGLLLAIAFVVLAVSCTLSKAAPKATEQPNRAPNGQAPVAGQMTTGGQAPMNGVQQPNIQPVAYDQYTGNPIYGYDQYTGRPIYGYDQYGRSIYGFDQNGYAIIGFDPNGYPIFGYDQYGQPIYDPTGNATESDSWRQAADERLEADMRNIEKKRYTSGLVRVFLLNIITLGLYRLYWIYKTTKFLNKYDTMNPKRDPGLSLLFCMFVPFYGAYWMYKTNLALEGMDEANAMAESAALMVGIFDIVAPVATLIYTQSKINDAVDGSMDRQPADFSGCKRSPVFAFFWSFITGGILGFFWTLRVATAIQGTEGFTLSPVAWAILGVIFPPANMFFALKVGRVIDSNNNRRCAHLAIASAMIPSFHIAILQERINQEI